MREPTNPHDANAIRILVDGVHVGFIPADEAAAWQPVLLECERRNQVLVGLVTFVGPNGWGISVTLRDSLPGFVGDVGATRGRRKAELVAARAAQAEKEAGDGKALLITSAAVERLAASFVVNPTKLRNARSVPAVNRRVIASMEQVFMHAAALKRSGALESAQRLLDLAIEGTAVAEELEDAADADEREDLADDLTLVLEEITEVVKNTLTV
jgi:hypothetical protein